MNIIQVKKNPNVDIVNGRLQATNKEQFFKDNKKLIDKLHGKIETMATEIERKFLVKDNSWRKWINNEYGESYIQGYLFSEKGLSIRVRLTSDRAWLTIKGKAEGLARPEFEYEIPFEDAQSMLYMCKSSLTKVRYKIPIGKHTWEIDEFDGDNTGLIIAEIELKSENEEFIKPDWVGEEVSYDPKYLNTNLSTNPFNTWNKK